MENDNKEMNERQERIPQNSKEKSYRLTIFVLSVILLACVMFSGFQSVYIFKLNSGREGILSYTRTGSTTTETTSEIPEETEDKPAEARPEPWFSLEDAAYVPSADKTRMTTVEIAKQVSPATVSLKVIGVDNDTETVIGSGTGFIITDDGYIVTNKHVVVLAEEAVSTYYVTVVLPGDDLPVRAEVVGSDTQTDIAVLKVDTDKKLPCVKMGDSDLLQAGELAVVIGNALGSLDDSVTVGVISAPSREINRNGYRVEVIQTDASVNPGSSGGPLINSYGEVVGITNSKIITSTSENVGFAIPVNAVKKVIEDIINYGKVVDRPYLGVSVRYVPEGSYYGAEGGIFVEEIVMNGPAYNAGFKLGDKLISMDGVEIKETGDIIKVRDSHKVGDTIEVVVERDGKEMTLSLTIADSADFPD
ncbi:MAG: PDZ domain-containing protein [Ruminococcaceae bacterium]|nr:PDZ domain-containing protein [Oscillospiraceae bacterium]